MIRLLLVLLTCLVLNRAADHDTFKDCSRVNFCNKLRSLESKDRYQGDYISQTEDTVGLALTLKDQTASKNLLVFLTTLEDNTFRIRIDESLSSRYRLEEVLDEEPKAVFFDNANDNNGTFTITAGDSTVIIYYDPFKIEGYLHSTLEFVFNGNQLVFDDILDDAYAFGITFPEAVQQYGIHEHADRLALQNTQPGGTDPYRLKNMDVAGYEVNSPMALYGAIPTLYGHGPNNTAGVFLHNAAEQWYEISQNSAYIMVESGVLDLFVLLGPTPQKVVQQYVKLTGTAHLPQLWALGYHQSRWNYENQDDLKDVVANFNSHNIPLDVIWLDIDYTDGKKYFTWDYTQFSDPVEMQQNISATHKRLVTIIDPHIKVEEGYAVYDGALEQDLFVKLSNGSNFEGDCWPGLSSYMDFLNPDAREYYGDWYSYEKFPNSTPVLAGIWNDMNEPSVFDNSFEKTIPGNAVHFGGVSHKDIHNIYGLLHTKATHQGLIARDNGTVRPFVLSRSHFSGTQRYSAIWTGDNTAEWPYLSISYDECLNANLLGIVFCGADVGGFDHDADVELLVRWYQAGVWLPFYRSHANKGTARHEPYLFNDTIQSYIRDAINLRYEHISIFYTLFYGHTRYGDPIIRPLWYHYPLDSNVLNISDHLLLGEDILVRAVAEPGISSVKVYFPGGEDKLWLSIYNNDVYSGAGFADISVNISEIPVFYRSGSIIFKKETGRLSTDEMTKDGYIVYVNLDSNGAASGRIYVDDFKSFDYVNIKKYKYFQFAMDGDEISMLSIDSEADEDDIDFVIEKTVINTVQASGGAQRRYTSRTFTKDSTGKLLKDMKLTKHQIIKLNL